MALPTRTMVAPSAIAAAMSPDMPIESVSIVKPPARSALGQHAQPGKGGALQRRVGLRFRNRHQAAQRQVRQRRDLARQLRQFGGRGAALGGLAADVHLQADVQRSHLGRTLFGQALGDFQALHGMHPGEAGGDRARLVALDRADEMPFDRRIRLRARHGGDLFDAFLQIVFTEGALPRSHGFEHGFHREGLRYGKQLDARSGPAGGLGRSGDCRFDSLHVGGDCGHNRFL